MKTCNKCGIEKPLDEFHKCKSKKDGRTSLCKECRNAHNRKYLNEKGYSDAYAKRIAQDPNYYKSRAKIYYSKNKSKIIKRVADRRKENPDARKKEYLNSRDKRIAYAKEWAKNNPEKRRAISLRYSRSFYANPENKPIIICRKLISRIFSISGMSKLTKTESALGYTKTEFKKKIESLFQVGMSWDNHGEWHVDHIKPIKAFIDEGVTEPKIINALDNLQPLWAFDNLSKGAKHDAE